MSTKATKVSMENFGNNELDRVLWDHNFNKVHNWSWWQNFYAFIQP